MTLIKYTFEGANVGATLTTANTGANLISAPGGSAVGTATAMHGGIAGSFTGTTSAGALGRFNASASSLTMACHFYFRMPVLPPNPGDTIATLRFSSGVALQIQVLNSGVVQIVDAAATTVTTAVTVAVNTWYRCEIRVVVATATTGHYTINFYAGDSATAINASPYASTTANLGTTAITAGDFGQVSVGLVNTVLLDDIAFNDGSVTEIGPPTAAPIAAFTFTTSALVATFSAASSTATSPATITGYAWTFGDGGTGTTIGPSHTYLTGGTYTVGLTVTDSNGGTAATSRSVTVAGSTAATVAAVVTSTGWTPVSGPLNTVVSDTSLASLFITTSSNPSSLPLKLKLTAMSKPPSGVGLTVPIAVERSTDATSGFIVCKLYDSDGTTLRSTLAAIAVTGVAVGAAVDPSNYLLPMFPAVDCATVVDWSGVVVEIDGTAS